MNKRVKRCLSIFCSVLVSVCLGVSAMAQDKQPNIQEQVQTIVTENGMDADVEQLNQEEYLSLWQEEIVVQPLIIELLDKLEKDGFKPFLDEKSIALRVTDNNGSNVAYMIATGYENDAGDTVVPMFIYSADTKQIVRIHAEKFNLNNKARSSGASLYHESSGLQNTARGNFNGSSFLCGLGAAVACTAYPAMIFALVPPAALIGGFVCSVAFSWLCSYA